MDRSAVNPGLLPPISTPEDFARAFDVSRETLERLVTYARLLEEWQARMNLVAASTLPQLWHRHMADSAQLAPLIPADAKTIGDLGSGAGFPGLVLAIMFAGRPGLRVHLVDSTAKKCAFLRTVAEATGAAVEIHCARIETLARERRIESVDIVTARALAPMDRLIEWARPYFGKQTRGLFLKGRDVEREVEAARVRWRLALEYVPSRTDKDGRIALVHSIAPVKEG